MRLSLRNIALLVSLIAGISLLSCEKAETSSFVVPSGSILLSMPGQTGTTTFTSYNIASIGVGSVPKGWEVDNIDLYTGTITVTAPSTFDDEEVTSGTLSLIGYSPTGKETKLSIYVAILQTVDVDYTTTPANCYIANRPATRYKFNPYIGGGSTQLATESIEILWQTKSNLVKYLDLRDGVASFYLENVKDEDDNLLDEVYPGNALIGARNKEGEIIWSWHIWITNSDPTAEVITLADQTVMNINLGADCNSDGSTDSDKIFRSYGLYYQWGRKDPIIGPDTWDFELNADDYLYDSMEKGVTYLYEPSTATTGNLEWTTHNPVSIVLGNADNGYDWISSGHIDTWAEATKSEQDPCPAGWRVPTSDIYASLTISAEDDDMPWQEAQRMYGWQLEDTATGEQHFFTASGRRNYLDGRLDIINDDPTRPIPWSGYYWTATTFEGEAVAMYFDLNSATRLWNGFDAARKMHRANALPLRCVKE